MLLKVDPINFASKGTHLKIVPIELREANEFIEKYHRHHKSVVGHKFSIGAATWTGLLVGVVIVGRPVARGACDGRTLEVTRLCTDGTRNACSFLYAAAARAAKALGYSWIQTYILESESGTSLLAAGWSFEKLTRGGAWEGTTKAGGAGNLRRNIAPTEKKKRWGKQL